MIGQPLSAAELNKVKNYLMGSALEGGTGSGITYSPEYIEKLKAAAIAKPKPKAAKGLLSAKPLQSTGLLQSPDTEFTTDNINPYTDAFTRDAVGPTVQETTAAARRGVPALPSAVATVPNDPNIAVSQLAPKVSKEVTTTTKPDGTKSEKIKHVEEPIKTTPKPNTANGDFIPADAMPKTQHNLSSLGDIIGARMGPAEAPLEPQMIPDTMDVSLPEKYRFAPTPPAAPISAQYPATMPAIPEERFKDTTGLLPAENTASQGLDTTISALAPLPSEEEASFNSLKEQRQAQIDEARAAAANFDSSYKPRTDMSALLSFIGSQLGRDYLKGYKAPAGLGDLVGMQDRLEQNIAKAKDGLSQTDLDYLKARMQLQDKQKTEESMGSKYMNLEILKAKAAGNPNSQTNLENKRQEDAEDRYATKIDYMPKILGYTNILENSVEIKKIMRRNKGVPIGNLSDLNLLSQALSEQAILVNKYDAGLGALSGPDKKILDEVIGIGSDDLPKWLKTVGNSERLTAVFDKFNQKMIRGFSNADRAIQTVFSRYPTVLTLHGETVKDFNKVKSRFEGVASGKIPSSGSEVPRSVEVNDVYNNLSPEEKKKVDAAEKKILSGK